MSAARLHSWTLPFYITAVVYALAAVAWLVIDPARPIEQCAQPVACE